MRGIQDFVLLVSIVILATTSAIAQTAVLAYYDSDSCVSTPNHVDVGIYECYAECRIVKRPSDWRSVQGFCDVSDYKADIYTAFGGIAYILVEVFSDSDCTSFQDATAFQATGECTQVIDYAQERDFAVYAVASEATGSVSIQYFVDAQCSRSLFESVPLIAGLSTEDLDVDVSSPSCDANNLIWTYSPGSSGSNGSSGLNGNKAKATSESSSASMASTDSSSSFVITKSPSLGNGSGSKFTPTTSSSSGSNAGLIAGIGGGVVVLVGLVVGVLLCCRRKKGKELTSTHGQYTPSLDQQQTASLTATPPYGVEMSGQAGLWSDDVITAKRISRRFVETNELISRGAFGEVYMGIFEGTPVAVKMLPAETRSIIHHVNAFLAEAKLTAMMNHPRIITLVGVAWNSLSDLCVVMEYMDGGDLRSLLTDYEKASHPVGFDRQKATIALHVCHALTYLHSLSPIVIHRDLKSRNILLNRDLEAKLTDFGISREQFDQTMTAGVGTSLWMAPEVMLGEKYDEKADMFSFGVVLSELDLHSLPYSQAKEKNRDSNGRRMPDAILLQQVAMGRLRVEFSESNSQSIVELGIACVSVNPNMRPTAAEALYKLQIAISKEIA